MSTSNTSAPNSETQSFPSPQSLINKTFTTLHNFNTQVLTDDFVFGTFESYKIKAQSTKNATIEYKAKVKVDNKDGAYSAQLSDESSIKFPFYNDKYWFWIGQRRNGDYKAHIDFGQHKIQNHEINFFTNLKTNIKFDKFALRLGANYFGQKCVSNSRIEHQDDTKNFTFTTRGHIKHGKFLYGFVGSLNLNLLQATKYDAFVGYETEKVDVYVKHLTAASTAGKDKEFKDSGFSLGTVNAAVVYRPNKKDIIGVEAQNDFAKDAYSFAVAGQHKQNDNLLLKAKVDDQVRLALAAKYTVSKLLTLGVSSQFELKKGAGAIDFSKGLLAFPFGFEATLNV